jgi:hypothetical protein
MLEDGESFVPQSQEQAPEPTAELPNPELNPLMNPTLGRNLGRWAEVYFTSPPEKREEAVVELLRELKGSPSANPPVTAEVKEIVANHMRATGSPQVATAEIPLNEGVQCGLCGHRYSTPQRFCGMCGAMIGAEQSSFRAEERVVSEPPRSPDVSFPSSTIFGLAASDTAAQDTLNGGSEISWLREKNLSGGVEEGSRISKFVPAALAILAIGALIYAQSRPQSAPTKNSAPTTAARKAPPAAPERNTAAPVKATPSPSDQSAQREAEAPATSRQAEAPTAPKQAVPSSPDQVAEMKQPARGSTSGDRPQSVPAKAAPAPVPEPAETSSSGAQEFALAEEYLNGKRGPRDSAEAAKFLWKAVGKENPSAILLLSDMYLVGDGVPKSCDQARLLLNAAVRKNVPQATQKLHNLLVSGCP